MPANSTLMTSVPSVTNTSVLGIQCVSPAVSSRPPADDLRTYSDELTLHMVDWFRKVPHDHILCKLLLTCLDDHLWTFSFAGMKCDRLLRAAGNSRTTTPCLPMKRNFTRTKPTPGERQYRHRHHRKHNRFLPTHTHATYLQSPH